MRDKFEDISKLIEKGKLDSAQKVLDAEICDDAEWHYLQSRVYYKRGWFLECKRHLERACELDFDNQQYQEELCDLLQQGTIELDPEEQRAKNKRMKRALRRSKRSTNEDQLCEACGSGGCECCCECCGQGLCEGLLSGC